MRITYEEAKDQRVNVRRPFWREFLIIWSIIVVCCVSSVLLYRYEIEMGMSNWWMALTGTGNVVFMGLLASLASRISNRSSYSGPIDAVAVAARKVAQGDFTVRVHHQRRDGKYDEMDALIDDFNLMVEELSSIQSLKEDFVSNVSHEIKTPLAIIENYAAALKGKNVTREQQEEYLETIAEAAAKLSALVSNVLRLNRMENQKILDVHSYAIDEQLRCCILSFMDKIDEKEIELDIEIPDNISICCDESLLEIVWNNLLNNAIKFTPPGGTIGIMLRQLPGEEARYEVSISDTGCGMTPETSRRIFDKFYQGDTSHTSKGNGLGLAMVKKVMELLDGDIRVFSEIDRGTTFTIEIGDLRSKAH